MINHTLENIPEWPPLYSLRYSQRAKRPFLQITRERGLEVVLPIRKRNIDISKLLNEKRRWIQKNLRKMLQRSPHLEQSPSIKPESIECLGISQVWDIRYEPKPAAKKLTYTLVQIPNPILTLKGKTDDFQACHRLLKKHLILEAHRSLIPWLQDLSATTGMHFNRAIIRGQSTLWGSCNAHKTISLNYKLLFLPSSLVKHVILHELCHTKYLNHSKNFWQYLKHWDEDCHENRKALKTADRYIPQWVNAS